MNKIHKENWLMIQVCVVLLMVMSVAKYGMVIETLLAIICLVVGGGIGSTIFYKIVKKNYLRAIGIQLSAGVAAIIYPNIIE